MISSLETSATTPSGTPDWNAAYSSLEAFLTTVHSMAIPAADGTQSVDGYFNGPFGSASRSMLLALRLAIHSKLARPK